MKFLQSIQFMIRRYGFGLAVCSVLGLFIFFYLFYTNTGLFPDQEFVFELIITVITANLIGIIIYKTNLFLDDRISWRERASLRLFTGIFTNYLIAATIAILVTGLLLVSRKHINFMDIFPQYGESIIKASIIVLCIILIYSIVHMILFSYHEYSVVQIEKVKLERKQLALQFEALRNQLSPHYLFNCFNTISSLVYKDAQLAETFIRRLAQTYHYVMTNNENHLVAVREEIEFVKSYYYLMKVRFDNTIDLSVDLSANVMSTLIPPLTLQILVENAIKHNLFSKTDPLHIRIDSKDHVIQVSNNILEKPKKVASFKVGLENISRRYNFFSSDKVRVEKDHQFRILLPLIESDSLKKDKVA